jgi:nucleotide-binding universal stress UspA family protein
VGDVAAAIDAHAHEYGADLIAMCKHGRSGIRQMIVGGIAQQILRGGGTPILLRTPKPEEAAASTFEPKEILLPLDAGHDADAALAAARTFASAYGARVTLLTAIPSLVEARQENVAARLLPRATAARLRMEQEDAEGRLQTQAGDLLGADIDAVFVVPEGDAEATILRYASEKDADLIILSTHARSGFEAWYTGSTGYRVIAHATQTLLLIREL